MSRAHAACPQCYIPLVVSFEDAAPAGEVVQQLYGCSVDDLYRFFQPIEWLRKFELPAVLVWGTEADWNAIADIWRESRARRADKERFLSFDEIERGWDAEE